jgi:hypothetical protein
MFSAQTNDGIHTLKGSRLSRQARTGLAELFSRGLDAELCKGASMRQSKTIPAAW